MALIHLLKKFSLLFLISGSLILSTCLAGRQYSKFVNELATEADAIFNEEIPQKRSPFDFLLEQQPSRHNEEDTIHGRLLKANTKDYGSYDPSPAFVKPPFKLIPN